MDWRERICMSQVLVFLLAIEVDWLAVLKYELGWFFCRLPLRCRRGREPPRVLVILPVGAEAVAYESLEFFPIAKSLTRDLSDTGCFAVLSVFPKVRSLRKTCIFI